MAEESRAINKASRYTCIFFDLDHTLWDYETNARETLDELYAEFSLVNVGIPTANALLKQFRKINAELWQLYDNGLITSDIIREQRFKKVLEPFNAYTEKLSEELSREYLYRCPLKNNLLPHTVDVLNYLAAHYQLTIITNGFEEIQHQKLQSGNLQHFFNHVITSQKAGYKKPSREIFEFALKANSISPEQAIMIGDNLITDIGGARNASIDHVFFNPDGNNHAESVTHEINSLAELREIL